MFESYEFKAMKFNTGNLTIPVLTEMRAKDLIDGAILNPDRTLTTTYTAPVHKFVSKHGIRWKVAIFHNSKVVFYECEDA